jgi:hypothetical protein
MSWQPTYPKVASKISDVPAICQGNFAAFNVGMNLEHTGIIGHTPGIMGLCYYGPTTGIAALSSPGSGSMAYDTTLGVFVYYTGAVWKTIGWNSWSRARVYANALNMATSAIGTAPAPIVFDAENYDTLNEYSTATGGFTAAGSGVYFIHANVSVSGSNTAASGMGCGLHLGGNFQESATVSYVTSAGSSPYHTLQVTYIGLIASGAVVSAGIYNLVATNTVKIVTGADKTYMVIHRLPWSGF